MEISVEVLMQKFGVDPKAAQCWFSSATGGFSQSKERRMSDEKVSLIGKPVRKV